MIKKKGDEWKFSNNDQFFWVGFKNFELLNQLWKLNRGPLNDWNFLSSDQNVFEHSFKIFSCQISDHLIGD
jgi:hypothetical protein